jgi:hypothetical protein
MFNKNYIKNGIEARTVIRAFGLDFNLGNVCKYILRYGHKGDLDDALRDLYKARDYLDYAIEEHIERTSRLYPDDLKGLAEREAQQ